MASKIRTVAWVGIGHIGKPVLDVVVAVASGLFQVKLLVRKEVAEYSKIVNPSVQIQKVDFESHTSLVHALKGVDALVTVLTFGPASNIDVTEIALINAAIEAGVKFMIPSEWAPDTAGNDGASGPWIGKTLRPNPVLASKRAAHSFLLARAAKQKISFAVVHPGVSLETCLALGVLPFDFKNKSAYLHDDGLPRFSATSNRTIGNAVVSILSNTFAPGIRNKFLFISDFTTTQSEVLSLIEQTLGDKPWQRISLSTEQLFDDSMKKIEQGEFGIMEFAGILSPRFWGADAAAHLDNELLGLPAGPSVKEEVSRLAWLFNEQMKG